MSIWNIPFARNPFFTGRDDLLARLHTQLRTTQSAAVSQPQAINGLGGIGKTQLVLEYAYRHRQEYQVVLWARADTAEALNASYTEIAKLLQLPQQDAQEQEVIVQAVKDWLRGTSGWLLILDNADDLKTVQAFLPTECPGHLLLTTRAQSMGKLARHLEVEILDREAGALLVLRRAGIVPEGNALEAASASDQSMALSLTQDLGGLPLALDQAGAYIEETQCSLADYAQQYRVRSAELLARRGGLTDDHPEPVATTWSLSFQNVEGENPQAAELLRACAFLAPDAIPEELLVEMLKTPLPSSETPHPLRRRGGWFSRFTSGRLNTPEPAHPPAKEARIDEAIALLRGYSLIQRNTDEKTLSVHRLVQAVVREALDEYAQQVWMIRVIGAVNTFFPEVSFDTWERCARYLPQALACETWIAHKTLVLQEGASLLYRAGWYLSDRAQYAEAEVLHRRALRIYEQALGPDHPSTGSTLHELGVLAQAQGKYAEAEALYRRVWAIYEQALGPDHPSTATVRRHYASLLRKMGRETDAKHLEGER